MFLLSRLFAARGMRSQQQVARRAARVIDRVIFDMGVERLLQGTMQLDRRMRPRFCGGQARTARKPLASVALADLRGPAVLDGLAPQSCSAAFVEELMREFRRQSARFQALPGPDADARADSAASRA